MSKHRRQQRRRFSRALDSVCPEAIGYGLRRHSRGLTLRSWILSPLEVLAVMRAIKRGQGEL